MRTDGLGQSDGPGEPCMGNQMSISNSTRFSGHHYSSKTQQAKVETKNGDLITTDPETSVFYRNFIKECLILLSF